MKSEIVKEYLLKYNKGSSRSIARMLMRDEPSLFLNYNTTRRLVIQIRKKLNMDSKPMIPPSIKNDFEIIDIKGNHKVLVLSDIHIPYHDRDAINMIMNYKLIAKPDIILLNGDIIDCYSLSKWEKDPRRRMFVDEVKVAKEFLKYLRQKFKKARIIYKYGNHEERFEKYLFYKAPELFGINEVELLNILELNRFGIEVVSNRKPIKLNELFILHGHEYYGYGLYVNPARSIFLRTKKNTLVGHYHQPSTHQEPTVDGKFITCWSTGCLCDLHPYYMPLNKWALGFAYIETNGNKEFNVNNYKIINKQIFNT